MNNLCFHYEELNCDARGKGMKKGGKERKKPLPDVMMMCNKKVFASQRLLLSIVYFCAFAARFYCYVPDDKNIS